MHVLGINKLNIQRPEFIVDLQDLNIEKNNTQRPKPFVVKFYLHNKQQENTDPNPVAYRSLRKMCPKGNTIFLKECIQKRLGGVTFTVPSWTSMHLQTCSTDTVYTSEIPLF